MRRNVVLVVLLAFAILLIYKFKTPSVIATENASEIQNANTAASAELDAGSRTPVAVPSMKELSPVTQKKISTLKEILKSKNDNDPRMDTELRNLSNEDKDALVNMYQNLKSESLNDKGTIVFLIGRELTRPEDAEFLKNVLSEEPCLSLENCGVPNAGADPHLDSINDVTLNYPQVVALNRVKLYLQSQNLENANPTVLSHLMDAVKIGQNSKSELVQNRSKELSNLLTKIKK